MRYLTQSLALFVEVDLFSSVALACSGPGARALVDGNTRLSLQLFAVACFLAAATAFLYFAKEARKPDHCHHRGIGSRGASCLDRQRNGWRLRRVEGLLVHEGDRYFGYSLCYAACFVASRHLLLSLQPLYCCWLRGCQS